MDGLDLSVFFHTKSQASDFLVRLSNFSEEIYKTDFNLENSLIRNFGVDKKDKFIIFLRDNHINPSSTTDIKGFLEKLTEKVTNTPTLSLTLAFEPNEETLKILNEWFSINIKKQFIFDISVNPHLIAGVAINFNGKYLDFSVKEKFLKIMKEVLETQTANATPSAQKEKTNVTIQK